MKTIKKQTIEDGLLIKFEKRKKEIMIQIRESLGHDYDIETAIAFLEDGEAMAGCGITDEDIEVVDVLHDAFSSELKQ